MDFQTFDLTQTQLRMLETADRVGNLCAVYRLEGTVDEKRLDRAIKDVVRRCAPFSYKLLRLDDRQQLFTSHDEPEGLSIVDAQAGDDYAFALIRSLSGRSFRLDGGAPYLFCLLKGREASYLMFVCHPAVIDRFSLKPLFAAISSAYSGQPPTSELGLDQAELIQAEKNLISSPKHHESIRFWLQLVRETSFEWHPARLEGDLGEGYFSVALPPERTQALKRLAAEQGLRIGDLLLFCFHLFMARMTRNDTVQTSYSHRIRSGPKQGIGFNENKPALKSVLDPEASVSHFLGQAARLFARARDHSDLPAREMARELLRLEPDYKRVTNLLFSEDPLPYGELKLPGVEATLLPHFSHRLEVEDVSIYFDVREEITFHALTRVPQEAAGLKMAFEHYLALLGRIDEELAKPVKAVTVFTEPLRKRALELADGGPLREKATDVLERFQAVAKAHPDAPAVRHADRRLSYRELHESALRIAGRLKPHFKKEEELVGICLPRGEGVVQSIFGIMAAGAGYVPLDPAMPAERLGFIARDSGVSAVIVDDSTRATIGGLVDCPLLDLPELLAPGGPQGKFEAVTASRVAYVIYTSGTTGKPKGVVVERGNLACHIAGLKEEWERGPGTRWFQFAAFTFDASVLGIFNPLAHGGEMVIAPTEARTDPEAVFRILSEARITHADMAPAMMPLLPRRPLPDLRAIYSGGEAIDEEAARFWSKAVELGNCYGPTEATVCCTINKLGGYKAATHLGRPLPGYQTYVLDDNGALTGIGGVGEICVGGDAVARGYLGRPELTAQKFIPNPFGPGRLYRTGDLARFLPNGELEFLGRCDFQVKIRGFRIELGDIEAAISEQPEVKGAHVGVLTRDGSKSLVAWYVSRNLTAETLRTRLAARLPHYMVPSFLVRVEAFPMTLNGKLDRARLPAPSRGGDVAIDQPLGELELRVRAIWAGVLKTPADSIGVGSHFFHLGGHSLLAALACNRLNAELGGNVRPKALFEHPLFADFCEHVRGLPVGGARPEPLVSTGASAAPVECRLIGLIYSRAMSTPDDNTYNIVSRLAFSKEIHPLKLRQALRDLLEANPIFRAAFSERGGRIWVESAAATPVSIPLIDASAAELDARSEAFRNEAFDVKRAPLWRAEIACLEDGRTTLLFSIHHGIFDGWSLNLFVEELSARYEGLERLSLEPTAEKFRVPARLTWFDYCLWSQGLSETPAFKSSIAYWRRKLAGAEALVELPTDFRQKRANSNASCELRFSPETVSALKKFADERGITLPPVLFSLYLVWLWRLSDQSELIVGYPYAGRDTSGTENIYASFVTMGFLRQEVDPDGTFADLAVAVHRQMIEDKEHLVAAPYDAEIANMDSLNAIFSLQSGISLEGNVGRARFKAQELPSSTSKGDLSGIFYQCGDGAIEGRIEFDASLFRREKVRGFAEAFRALVADAAERPQARVGELRYQSQEELARFLALSSGGGFEQPDQSITARFSQMARERGAHPAVRFGETTLSYAELERLSDAIAAGVLAHVKPGARVGLGMQKSERLLAAVLGILKAGCAYVPLDPSYPPERLKFFAENCALAAAVVDSPSRSALTNAGLGHLELLDADELARAKPVRLPPVSPDSLAYIIHTSGSTGTPKGVMIEHRTVTRMILGSAGPMDFDSSCTATLIGPISFDTSVLELFMPLLNGGTLAVINETDRKDPVKLHAAILRSGASHVDVSPVMLANMPREPLPGVTHLGFGGDTIDEATADWWSRQTRLISLYGPTEITVQCSVGQVLPDQNPRIIGKPLPGYRVYLLNSRRQPVLEGAAGEICVGGDNLARGYLNRDDLTLERFVSDPFGGSPYAFMYLTGDLGRFLPDGTIEFLGRNDAQIKLRGFRIELGEIENRLSTFPGLTHVACAAKGEGDRRYLAAYYVAASELNVDKLRAHLTGFLPDYMIPSFFVRLPELPASPNGKIDRKRLPAVAAKTCANPPHEGLERELAAVWEDVLRLKGVGRDENFFHIGGNSLLAVRLQAEIRKRLKLEFSIGEFYGAPTIEALAARKHASQFELATADVAAGLGAGADFLKNVAAPATLAARPRTALLTGARGFLGVFLLAELTRRLDRVYCLVRCGDAEEGRRAVLAQAQAAGLELDPLRFEIIPGDLAAPNLGLEPGARGRLAAETDVIIHCGAFVHHLHSYQTMRAANVEGTRELLRLALETKRKRFCFVSTLTVATAARGVSAAPEAVPAEPPGAESGYILTKWVGERLVEEWAAQFGVPAVVARPGNITGSTNSGFTNYANNHFWLFTKGCLQLGAYPELGFPIDLTPVDMLASAIAALSLAPAGGFTVANLSNPETLSQKEFFEVAADCGLRAKAAEPREWQKLLATIGEDNGLSTIREFYTGDLSGRPMPVALDKTTAALTKAGATLAGDGRRLLPVYLEYLKKAGFLEGDARDD